MMATSSPAPHKASATFPFAAPFLPLAIEFAEKAAGAFGFGQHEIAGLVLAVEEIYSYYLDQLAGAASIDLTLDNERYQLRLDIRFRMAHPNLRAFNLTYRVDPDDEDSLAGLGLMIAARSVTRLSIEFGSDEQVCLHLVREREYPRATLLALPEAPSSAEVRLHTPSREDLRYFGGLLASGRSAFLPSFLERPEMAADMVDSGALGAILASAGETLSGGVFWRRLSESTIELFGPYLLFPEADDDLLTRLLDDAVGRISRSGARALLRRQGPLLGFERFFDFLGELKLASTPVAGQIGEGLVWPHYYKQLREESGGVVYAEPRFAAFLRGEYDRLCLPRQVRETSAAISSQGTGDASVLSIDFEHRRSLATLRLLAKGSDLPENLAAHLALLAHERIANVFVEIDSGREEEIGFVAVLYDAGFLPRLLIPDAGRGDLILFAR
jgi:anti-sigma regulatory factor (Ser/Thr protein kinase)